MKSFAFFPGCVLNQAAKEAKMSLEAIAKVLNWELKELLGWSCCGATQASSINQDTALIANARNLALAEKMALPLLTTCSTCKLSLQKAKMTLEKTSEKDRINGFLKTGKMEYKGSVEITSLLMELLADLENVKKNVKKPLKDLNVAVFYGCHSIRPSKLYNNNSANPTSFEDVAKALGANVVEFEKRLDCCGFHASYPAEKSVKKMSSAIVNEAAKTKAHCIVTPCPLCQMQLDIFQERFQEFTNSKSRLPIIHLSQLVGLAFGLSSDEIGLNYNIQDATKLA